MLALALLALMSGAASAQAQSYPPVLSNTATITLPADVTDPAPADNTATDDNALAAQANLSLVKTLLSARPALTGSTVQYQLLISNAGPGAVVDAAVSDVVPAELDAVSWTCVASGGSCSQASGSGDVVVNVSLAAGQSATVVVSGTAPATAGSIGANTATVSPPPGVDDPDPGDNQDDEPPVPVVPPVDAQDDSLSLSAAQGSSGATAVLQVLDNDRLNGALISDASLVTITATATAALTIQANGQLDVAAGTAVGSYSIDYTLCEVANPGNCDSATVTVVVSANPQANLSLVKTLLSARPALTGSTVQYQLLISNAGPGAVVDAAVSDVVPAELGAVSWTCVASGGSCSQASGSGDVVVNVSLAAGQSATVVVSGTAPATAGSIGANTATVSPPPGVDDPDPGDNQDDEPPVPVVPPVDAQDDSLSLSAAQGSSGATAVLQVLDNDRLNGALISDASLVTITATATAALTIQANGQLDVAAGTAVGSYSIDYTLCEVANPGNCDSATVTVVVSANPQANLSLVKTLLSARPALTGSTVQYQLLISNAGPGAVVDAAVSDVVPAELGAVSWTCVASGGSCSQASGSGDVVVNVSLAAGQSATVVVSGTAPATAGSIGANTATVSPPPGVDDPDPGDNQDDEPPVPVVPPVDAQDDSLSLSAAQGSSGATAVLQVLDNDRLNGALISDASLVTITTTATAALTIQANGQLDVAAGTAVGSYSIDYTLCEVANPGNCDSATVTVVVSANPQANLSLVKTLLSARPALTGSTVQYQLLISNAGPGAVVDAAVSDVVPAELGAVSWTCVASGGSCSQASGSGDVVVNVSLAAGQSATVVVSGTAPATAGSIGANTATVSPPPGVDDPDPGDNQDDEPPVPVVPPVDAQDDSLSLSAAQGSSGATAVLQVLDNDRLNGALISDASLVTITATATAALTIQANGQLDVAAGTAVGSYSIDYTLCEVANPGNCDSATVTVVVSANAIDAVDDAPNTGNPIDIDVGASNIGNVLDNDLLAAASASVATVSVTQLTGTDIRINADGSIDAGIGNGGLQDYDNTASYRICEIAAPDNCDSASVVVEASESVIEAPYPEGEVVANDDSAELTAEQGMQGVPTVLNALVNDTLDGSSVLLPPGVSLAAVSNGPLAVASNGEVTLAAATAPGVYTLPYSICQQGYPANCDSAVITVSVAPAGNLIDAVDDAPNTGNPVDIDVGASNIGNVLDNDLLAAASASVATVSVTQLSGTDIRINADGSIDAGIGNGGLQDYDNTASYRICEIAAPDNCDSASVVVEASESVIEAPYPEGEVVANDDSAELTAEQGIQGVPTVLNALVNDTLDGSSVLLPPGVSLAAVSNGPLAVAGNGEVTLAAATAPGVYTLPYSICQQGYPTNCDSAVITVTVALPPPDLEAADDLASIAQNQSAIIQVLANDTVNQLPAAAEDVEVRELSPAVNGSVRLNADATVSYVPQAQYSGADRFSYTVCATSDDSVCATANVQVIVAPNRLLLANDEGSTPLSQPIRIAVLDNDSSVSAPLQPSTLQLALPAQRGDVVCAEQACIYTPRQPAASAAGVAVNALAASANPQANVAWTDQYQYRVCDVSVPEAVCATATVFITVLDEPAQLRLSKRAAQRTARVGDLVRYTLVADNIGTVAARAVNLLDQLPAGFSLVSGSLRVEDSDGAATVSAVLPLRVDGIDVDVGQRATLVYYLRVGAGVGPGVHSNRAVLRDASDRAISNEATADVEVRGDPVLDDALIIGSVFDDRDGNGLQDAGERGVPGVRIGSLEGLFMETDAQGRFHLVGITPGSVRGSNFYLKVDPATLPAGTSFTTENPRLRRLTPGLPVRFDFGVRLPQAELGGGLQRSQIELGELLFEHDSAAIDPQYLTDLDRIAERIRTANEASLLITASADREALAFERAVNVREALNQRLGATLAMRTPIEIRTELDAVDSTLTLDDGITLGELFFDTGSAAIKPRYRQLISRMAAEINMRGGGRISVAGHADRRAGSDYNQRLSEQRARAVMEAIGAELGDTTRSRLKVDVAREAADGGDVDGH